jgi:hypothetical protein
MDKVHKTEEFRMILVSYKCSTNYRQVWGRCNRVLCYIDLKLYETVVQSMSDPSYCLKLNVIRKRSDFWGPIQVSRLQKFNETYHSHSGSSTDHSDSPETGKEKGCCISNRAFNWSRFITYLMI